MESKYYYFNPFIKQYYFPKGFAKYQLFTNFYQPYTLKGRLLWMAWLKSSVLRSFCIERNPKKVLPLINLEKYVPKKSMLAFNRGTEGVEQKTTVLGIDTENGEQFFIKYAETKLAQSNVHKEGIVLQQIQQLDFVPEILLHENNDTFTLLKTTVLQGKRHTNETVDTRIIAILKTIAIQKVSVSNAQETHLQTSFAHGDFCPWNMMNYQESIWVFDWELASNYPLGYDLFTYVFQTNSLLHPKKNIELVYQQNKETIVELFNHWEISNHIPYLVAFANIKLELERKKQNDALISAYEQLVNYVKTL